jgi:hypothetical protein
MRKSITAAIVLASLTPASAAPPSPGAGCLVDNMLIGARLFPKANSAELVRVSLAKCRKTYAVPDPSPELHAFLKA